MEIQLEHAQRILKLYRPSGQRLLISPRGMIFTEMPRRNCAPCPQVITPLHPCCRSNLTISQIQCIGAKVVPPSSYNLRQIRSRKANMDNPKVATLWGLPLCAVEMMQWRIMAVCNSTFLRSRPKNQQRAIKREKMIQGRNVIES